MIQYRNEMQYYILKEGLKQQDEGYRKIQK